MSKEPDTKMQMEFISTLSGVLRQDETEFDDEDEMDWGDMPMEGADLAEYEETIKEKMLEYDGGTPCDLCSYYSGNEQIREKIESAIVSVKCEDGILYGCTTLTVKEPLSEAELEEFSDYLTGQYSDGWGEGFEQQDIPVDGGNLNVSFWRYHDFQIQIRPITKSAKKQEKKLSHPKMKLLGHDGNIFSILGDAKRLLVRNGQRNEADEMFERVKESGNYYQALGIISEYVETELSDPRQKKKEKTKKTVRGECR